MSQPIYQSQHFGEEIGNRFRTLSTWAVISVVLGCLSFMSYFAWQWYVLPITGLIVGWISLMRINEIPQELTGKKLAIAGMAISGSMLLFFGGWDIVKSVSEVPPGYKRLTYDQLQPDPEKVAVDGGVPVSDRAMELSGQFVYVTGYIKSQRKSRNLREFILCPIVGHCNFCNPDPNETEMIRVTLTGNLNTNYSPRLFGIGGRLTVDPHHPTKIPYHVEADYMR